MTKVVNVTAQGMFKKTGMKHALGYSLPEEDTILVRKGLPKELRKEVLGHEEEHMIKGEEGPFSLGGLIGGLATSALGGLLSKDSGGGARQAQTQNTFSQANPFSFDTGLISGGFNKGKVSYNLSPELQALQGTGALGALSNQLDLLGLSQQLRRNYGGQLANFDVNTAAQDLYSQLSPARERDFQNQYLGLENRLFNQGRLGSTGPLGGQSDLEALFRAQEAQRSQDLFSSYDKAQNAQKSLFGLLSGAAALPGGVLSNDLAPLMSIQKMGLAPFDVFGKLAGAKGTQSGTINKTDINPSLGSSIGTGLLDAGGSILTNILKDAFK